MKTQDFRKLLLVGTAIVAVGVIAPVAVTPAFAADEISVDADANGTFDGDELATSPFDWGTNTNGTGAAGEATDTFDVQVNADATIGGLQNGDTIGETGTNASAIFAGADALTLTLDDDVNDDAAETVTINGNVNLNGQTSFNLTINGNDDDATGDAFTVDINGNVDLGTGTLTIDTDTNAGNTVGVNLSGNLTAAATVLSADNNALTLTIDGGGAQVIAGTINGGAASEGDIIVSNAAGTTFSGAIGGTAALDTITLTGAATTGFSSTVSVGTLSVDNAGATADVNGNLTGAVNFGADGTLDLAAGVDVSGAIDNDSGGDTIGTITLDSTGGTTIGGAVGATNTLKLITANGTGTAAFGSTVAADDIDFGAAGTITFANDVTTANGLDFANNAGTVTFADNADLTGNIISTGGANGTLNFTGTTTITGALGTSAANGIAAINVNGASETVTVTGNVFGTALTTVANSTYDGQGNTTLTGAVTNGGTINLGVGDTLTADGGFAGAGTYAVTLTDDGDGTLNAADYGSLASAGAIDLSAETVAFTVGANVANGTAVFATGGAAATAGGTVTDNSLIHTVTLAANGNNIEVTVAQNTSGLATTTNNQNVGTVLDSLAGTSNTELSQIQTQLAAATTAAALGEVLEATQPTVDGGAVAAGLGVVTSSTGMAQTRLASLRSGETGMAAGDSFTGRSIWGQIFGTTGQQDKRDNIDGYDIDTVGAAIGADTGDAGDDWVLGLALGYANSEVDSDNANNTQTDIDTYQVSLYGQYDVDDRTFVNAQVGYAYNDNETKRYNVGGVSGLTASGDYSSDVYYARAEIGRDYAQDAGLTLTPTLMANYVHYDAEDYTETGAGGANLTIDSDAMNIFELGIGLDAAWKTQTRDGGYIEPVLHAGVRHDLIGDEVEATSTFSGGGASFKTTGFDPAQTTFDVGAGVTYYAASNWEFVADYDYEAKSDYDSHSALLKAQYKF